jgi:hypothetical protein
MYSEQKIQLLKNIKSIKNNKIKLINNYIKHKNEIINKKKQNLDNYINFYGGEDIYKIIINKIKQKNDNNYSPMNNNTRYLILFASHCDSDLKYNTIKDNLKYFDFENIDILFINSIGLPYNENVKLVCNSYKNIKYIEIENSKTYDFGKWIYGLQSIDYQQYNYIIFTNDSYVIHESINHFFNLLYNSNSELFGYNDSTQCRYHYQSYLFALKKESIPKFIEEYNLEKDNIQNQEDVIFKYELKMTDWFKKNECFLSIGNIESHKGLNIFFTNDNLYEKLKSLKLLPFTKIKRILQNN